MSSNSKEKEILVPVLHLWSFIIDEFRYKTCLWLLCVLHGGGANLTAATTGLVDGSKAHFSIAVGRHTILKLG